VTPLISIVIPTLNGMATLPSVFDALRAQKVDAEVEVVAVDSGSTDGTAEFLRPRVRELLQVTRDEFNHGLTRNAAVARTRGDLVVLLVQDAVPAAADWLAELIRPLREDSTVAGSFARQRPGSGACGIGRRYLEQWVACGASPRVSAISGETAFAALAPADRHILCAFDNVCSCIRRSVWTRHPFRATAIAEDLAWAKEVLLAGYRLTYVPAAAVVHSHRRPVSDEFRRTRLVHERLRTLFGLATVPDARSLARAIAVSVPRHIAWVASDGRWPDLARAVGLGVAFPLGQYLGAREADRRAVERGGAW
jgi:rhamnosyltransferase